MTSEDADSLVGGVGGFLGSLLAHRDSDLDPAASRDAAAQVALATHNERAHKRTHRQLGANSQASLEPGFDEYPSG